MLDKFKILMICTLVGSFLGAFFCMNIDTNSLQKLVSFIFFESDNNFIGSFIEFCFKFLKYFLAIWFLGFINYGILFIYIINFCKGFSIGFCSSVLIIAYKLDIIKFIFNKYFFQNCIIILFMLYLSYKAIKFSTNKKEGRETDFYNYFICLVIVIVFNIFLYFLF